MIFHQLFDPTSSTYTYFIGSERTKHAIIIDPVIEHIDDYVHLIHQHDLKLVASIDTHLHADHVTGSGSLAQQTGCSSMMGKQTKAEMLTATFTDGEQLKFEDISLKAIYTPGHTDDSYCFLLNDMIFTGDTLLIGGTGRTDFQNGSAALQYESLFTKILTLPPKTKVYPCHDYKGNLVSTIGQELETNPRLQVKSKQEYIDQMNQLNLDPPKYMHIALPANLQNGLSI